MEILGKAARVFLGNAGGAKSLDYARDEVLSETEGRSDNTGTAKLFERRGLESEGRVVSPPKIRETFAGPPKAGKSDLSEKTGRDI